MSGREPDERRSDSALVNWRTASVPQRNRGENVSDLARKVTSGREESGPDR